MSRPLQHETLASGPQPAARRARKAYVIGNCQVKSLAYSLNYYVSDVDFDHVQVHSLHPSKAEDFINKRIGEIKADGDFILAFNLSDKFFGLARDEIEDTFSGRQLLTISNLFFAGYHPDIAVIGLPHKRIDGPLDQYRSRIALYGYMEGLSIADTIALYNAESYQKLGYYKEWHGSVDRLVKSDDNVDIKFAQAFADLLPRRLSMYVLNHPTPVVFSAWAKLIATNLAGRGMATLREWQPDEALFPALFTDTSVFPVYPEIAAHHGLAFPGSYLFKTKAYQGASFLTLEEYLQAEFTALDGAGRDAIRQSSQWPVLDRRFAALRQ